MGINTYTFHRFTPGSETYRVDSDAASPEAVPSGDRPATRAWVGSSRRVGHLIEEGVPVGESVG